MSAVGHSRPCRRLNGAAAIHPITDIRFRRGKRRFGPGAAMRRSKMRGPGAESAPAVHAGALLNWLRLKQSISSHDRVIAPSRIEVFVHRFKLGQSRHRDRIFETCTAQAWTDDDDRGYSRRRLLGRDRQGALTYRSIGRDSDAIGKTGAGRSIAVVIEHRQFARLGIRVRLTASSPILMPSGMKEPKPPWTRAPSVIHSSGVSALAEAESRSRIATAVLIVLISRPI